MNAIRRAIDLCGGVTNVAKLLRVTPQAVCFWRDQKRKFPVEHCPVIERATDGAVSCEDLRPDFDWAYVRRGKCNSCTE